MRPCHAVLFFSDRFWVGPILRMTAVHEAVYGSEVGKDFLLPLSGQTLATFRKHTGLQRCWLSFLWIGAGYR